MWKKLLQRFREWRAKERQLAAQIVLNALCHERAVIQQEMFELRGELRAIDAKIAAASQRVVSEMAP